MIETLIITFAAVLVGSNVPDSLASVIEYLKKKTGRLRVKPLDCDACMVFWTTFVFNVLHSGAILVPFSIAYIVYTFYSAWAANKIEEEGV